MSDKNKYFYRAFGLNICSEIVAPNWLQPNENNDIDIKIKLAPIRSILQEKPQPNTLVQHINEKTLLSFKETANFLIYNGDTIVIDTHPKADISQVQLCLFGSAMGALLQQREFLTIHGCGIVHDNNAYLFVGNSGIGKSTLACAFAKKNYSVTNDDICAIKTSSLNPALLHPGYPQLKIWQTAAEKLNIDTKGLTKVCDDEAKYFLPIKTHWDQQPLPIKHIYFLDSQDSDDFSITALNGAEKMIALKLNTYRNYFLQTPDLRAKHMQFCKELLANTYISILKRPKNRFAIQGLVKFIEQKIINSDP